MIEVRYHCKKCRRFFKPTKGKIEKHCSQCQRLLDTIRLDGSPEMGFTFVWTSSEEDVNIFAHSIDELGEKFDNFSKMIVGFLKSIKD